MCIDFPTGQLSAELSHIYTYFDRTLDDYFDLLDGIPPAYAKKFGAAIPLPRGKALASGIQQAVLEFTEMMARGREARLAREAAAPETAPGTPPTAEITPDLLPPDGGASVDEPEPSSRRRVLGYRAYQGSFYDLGYARESAPWASSDGHTAIALGGLRFYEHKGITINTLIAVLTIGASAGTPMSPVSTDAMGRRWVNAQAEQQAHAFNVERRRRCPGPAALDGAARLPRLDGQRDGRHRARDPAHLRRSRRHARLGRRRWPPRDQSQLRAGDRRDADVVHAQLVRRHLRLPAPALPGGSDRRRRARTCTARVRQPVAGPCHHRPRARHHRSDPPRGIRQAPSCTGSTPAVSAGAPSSG